MSAVVGERVELARYTTLVLDQSIKLGLAGQPSLDEERATLADWLVSDANDAVDALAEDDALAARRRAERAPG